MPKGNRPIFLQSLSGRSTMGTLVIGPLRFKCALGRTGRKCVKREGDGATPRGTYALRRVFFRPDRSRRPTTGLPVAPLGPSDGWCDSPGDRNYNRRIRHPYPASAEVMWRTDHLYDIVVVTSHNERPRIQRAGSAVFIHLAREGYLPTEGCIALERGDMLKLLSRLGRNARVRIP